jgi:acyl-CoA thioesterase II
MPTHLRASVHDLLRALRLERIASGGWEGTSVPTGGPAVFGGQLVGQAIQVAAAEAPGKTARAIHTIFARAGKPGGPITLVSEKLHDGRTFASRTVTASQGDRRLAQTQVLLDAPDEDVIRHGPPCSPVGGPDDGYPQATTLDGWEIRSVEDIDFANATSVGPPNLRIWSRFAAGNADPHIARALLSWASVGFFIGIALRPHAELSQEDAHRTLSTGPVTHSLTFHDGFAADEWLLLDMRSSHAGGGRAYGTGEVFTRDGRLVANFSQESMIRRLTTGGAL